MKSILFVVILCLFGKKIENKDHHKTQPEGSETVSQITSIDHLMTLEIIRSWFVVIGKPEDARKVIFFRLGDENISLLINRGKEGKLILSLSVHDKGQDPNRALIFIDYGANGSLDAMWFPGDVTCTEDQEIKLQEVYKRYISCILGFLLQKTRYWPDFY